MLVVCANWPNIPCVDDLPFRVSVEDNVAVTTIELSICLGFHRNSAAAFHTPDLGNTEIIGKCWTSFWDTLRSILLYHPLSSLSLCSQVLCYKARKDSSWSGSFYPTCTEWIAITNKPLQYTFLCPDALMSLNQHNAMLNLLS